MREPERKRKWKVGKRTPGSGSWRWIDVPRPVARDLAYSSMLTTVQRLTGFYERLDLNYFIMVVVFVVVFCCFFLEKEHDNPQHTISTQLPCQTVTLNTTRLVFVVPCIMHLLGLVCLGLLCCTTQRACCCFSTWDTLIYIMHVY